MQNPWKTRKRNSCNLVCRKYRKTQTFLSFSLFSFLVNFWLQFAMMGNLGIPKNLLILRWAALALVRWASRRRRVEVCLANWARLWRGRLISNFPSSILCFADQARLTNSPLAPLTSAPMWLDQRISCIPRMTGRIFKFKIATISYFSRSWSIPSFPYLLILWKVSRVFFSSSINNYSITVAVFISFRKEILLTR